MLNKEDCKGKHLQMEERLIIEYGLDQNYSLKELAEKIQKDPTTVSKEIKSNRFLKVSKIKANDLQPCKYHKNCTRTNLCNSSCNKKCKKSKFVNCYRNCKEYSIKKCSKLDRYPYVCNGCDKVTTCKGEKQYYRAKTANTKYKEVLVSSREGLNITPSHLKKMDEIISPLVFKGQSICHIFTHHKDELNCCESTLYSYFDKNVFTARNIDLPRKVKYKPRKKSKLPKIKDSSYRVGRNFNDFNEFIAKKPNTSIIEMDTVHGTRSGKVLLTLMFRNCSLMLVFILDSRSQLAVKRAIDKVYELIGSDIFKSTFPVLLTDNGSEFKNPEMLELDAFGNQRTKIFYCNPMASYPKPP